ncbi:hypothetical protein [Pedosphaera parvula]|uniref:Soluble ligand binding domain-containing protein n=1 Tax=Pedosphaera parvula (strain Ellin514) TaxID=320771 RepID=B9XGK1_PEDPL|nr:hypothetical protein [Pedosphaera parvula]EEF61052.1 hypothetical protein Cflav_PD3769 [Pedosphaera parvula Ellin514]
MKCMVCFLILAISVAGCTSEKEARRREVKAYWTGQQQGTAQGQAPKFTVLVLGNVANHTIPWTIELTLAKALIEASYQGLGNPVSITVTRNGEAVKVDPIRVLRGYDFPLEAGDRIELAP